MTTSGQTLVQRFDVAQVFDHVVRRCGVPTPGITPEMVQICRDNLYLQFLEWGNRGPNLWCQEKIRLGLTPNRARVALPLATIDLLQANRASATRLAPVVVASSDGGTAENVADGDVTTACVQNANNGSITLQFAEPQTVALVGVLFGAAITASIIVEVNSAGPGWLLSKTVPSATYAEGEWLWMELETPLAKEYLQIRAAGASAPLVVLEIYPSTGAHEVPMSRLNRDEYFSLPNKNFQGDPLQFWLDRQVNPVMVLWPTPRDTFQHIVALRHRHIQDPGDLTDDLEVPHRWFESVTWDLALRVIHELPGADLNRVPLIEKQAGLHSFEAESEERDNSPFRISPRIGAYTR